MTNKALSIRAKKVIDKLASSEIGAYVDTDLTPPKPFRGKGKIKLIILGQDPTVHNPEYNKKDQGRAASEPGLKHKIYKQQMDGYLAFMKKHVNP